MISSPAKSGALMALPMRLPDLLWGCEGLAAAWLRLGKPSPLASRSAPECSRAGPFTAKIALVVTRSACAKAEPGQAVVAVLGMAHVNGVATLLDRALEAGSVDDPTTGA